MITAVPNRDDDNFVAQASVDQRIRKATDIDPSEFAFDAGVCTRTLRNLIYRLFNSLRKIRLPIWVEAVPSGCEFKVGLGAAQYDDWLGQ